MRKEILELLNRLRIAEQKLNNWKFDFNTVLERIKLLREKWEVEKLLNLYTPEEIFTAVNYEALKRHMQKRKIRRQLKIEREAEDEEEEQRLINERYKNQSFLEVYFLFILMYQMNFNNFLELGAYTTKAKRIDNDKKNNKLPV